MNLVHLNSWSEEEAKRKLLLCCHSTVWATKMTARRPFESKAQLLMVSDEIWSALAENDWLEAFSAHPRIGGAKTSGPEKSKNWSKSEQSGMTDADQLQRDEMKALNESYFEKFGFVFLICATGKSADQMLNQLKLRLANERGDEIKNAVIEHSEITKIRLEKLI